MGLRWRLFLLGIAVAALVGGTAAAWRPVGRAALMPLDRAIRPHERLHFALHLAAGRVLSVCPCTRGQAHVQYWKAAVHAPTAMEQALVTSGRPRSVRDGTGDLVALTRYSGWVARHSPGARRALASLGMALIAAGMTVWLLRASPTRNAIPP